MMMLEPSPNPSESFSSSEIFSEFNDEESIFTSKDRWNEGYRIGRWCFDPRMNFLRATVANNAIAEEIGVKGPERQFWFFRRYFLQQCCELRHDKLYTLWRSYVQLNDDHVASHAPLRTESHGLSTI